MSRTEGKNRDWMWLDELGHTPNPDLPLCRVTRCPYCGRYIERGLLRFLRHATEDCPYKQTYTFSLKEDDVIEFTNNKE